MQKVILAPPRKEGTGQAYLRTLGIELGPWLGLQHQVWSKQWLALPRASEDCSLGPSVSCHNLGHRHAGMSAT